MEFINCQLVTITGFIIGSIYTAREISTLPKIIGYFDDNHVKNAVTVTSIIFLGIGFVLGRM